MKPKQKSKQEQLKSLQDEIDRLEQMSKDCLKEQQEAAQSIQNGVEQGAIPPGEARMMFDDHYQTYGSKQRELKKRAISLLVEKMRIKQTTRFVVVGKGGRA